MAADTGCDFVLDWRHVAMRFEHALQAARGLGAGNDGAYLRSHPVRELATAKWKLWLLTVRDTNIIVAFWPTSAPATRAGRDENKPGGTVWSESDAWGAPMSGISFPKLHNAMWPGLVGKGADSEPPIALDTMLEMTAAARVDGARFDGVDLFLADPHTSIDSGKEDIKRLADKIGGFDLAVGSLVAPVWPPVGGGSAMGAHDERKRFLTMVEKACRIGRQLRDIGIRPSGVVRIDSATGVSEWAGNPATNQKKVADTFKQACDVAESFGERLAAEGEICWGGMHSWKHMVELLEMVGRPATLGFQADMAHTLLYTMGYNAPEHCILPEGLSLIHI